MMKRTWIAFTALAWLLGGCAGSVGTTRFLNERFNFAFVERVAVLPLENFSSDRQAGVRATRLLITEILASGAIDVVEPGEVQAQLDRIKGVTLAPSPDQVKELGRTLNVQAIIVGTVAQSELVRSGLVQVPVVTLDLHMLETETAAAVWAATHSERGESLTARFLGTGAEPMTETTRRCVRQLLKTLVE